MCNKYNHHYHYQHQQHQQVILLFVTFQLFFPPIKQFKLIKKGSRKNIPLYLKHIKNNEPLNVNNEMRRAQQQKISHSSPRLIYLVPTIKCRKNELQSEQSGKCKT
jgi:hypothetical protein